MLKRLTISNYALIDNLDITFSPKLNIVTGETGAGKSIILGALSLILGNRVESRYFFNQQKKCVIEGTFEIRAFQIENFFQENDLDYELETVLRREIAADGKSRAFINDTPVSASILRGLGEKLIDIHSQHAMLEINDEQFQLLVVDTLAENADLLLSYRALFLKHKNISSALKKLIAERDQAEAERDYIQFQFDELERARLVDDEDEALDQELNTLTHAEEIKKNLIAVDQALAENEVSVLSILKEAAVSLGAAARYSVSLTDLQSRLESTIIELKDIASEISGAQADINVDEARLDEVNERLSLIHDLQKKHRVNSSSELIAVQGDLAGRLAGMMHANEAIGQHEDELNKLESELSAVANELSSRRNAAIPEIQKRASSLLAEVGMPAAMLVIENDISPQSERKLSGIDRIRFLFSANKGQQPMPVNKIASGGELSRLMLTIKSLIATQTALPTIIFDEIDTGISGETALRVGRIMEQLSQDMQVIAITHLPQIASRGNSHFTVYKEESGDATYTNIRRLDVEEREREIARMLSGNNPGESAVRNAQELLK